LITKSKIEGKPIEILLVEDNDLDVILVRDLLRRCRVSVQLTVAPNGEDALSYLRKEAYYSNPQDPDLILLDWNLPRKDGRQVLAEVKGDPELQRIPVTILSSSNADSDIQWAQKHGVDAYLLKPSDLAHYMILARHVEDFWIKRMQSDEEGL
jgi:two-component system response regulator